jgi:hypothetical protein
MKYTLILLGLISVAGCDKETPDPSGPLTVENYVELLRNSQYESLELPAFTAEDIPALLEYRNEKELITDYPVNFISSYGMPECRLGIYILWTIE